MKFNDILNIFKNEVEPFFSKDTEYINEHKIRYCFSALMLLKFIKQSDRILDVGGEGIFAYLMEKLTHEGSVTLLGHYSSESIEKFNRLGISFISCENFDKDKIETTFKYNAILLFEVIEHLLDPIHLLLQLYNACEEHGKIFCTTPNIASSYSISQLRKFMNPFCFAFYSSQQLDIGHKREFTPLEIQHLMNYTGFNVKYLTTFRSFNYDSNPFLGGIIKYLSILKKDSFVERKNLRGRSILYVGSKGLKQQQVRYPNEFYRNFIQPC